MRFIDSATLFISSHNTLYLQSPPPPSFSLLSASSALPPIPTNFPIPKLIPKTGFIIDGFRHAGDYSVSYFLSHFHSDHYTGITPNWSRGIIFCSPITARLLIQVLKVPSPFVVPVHISEPIAIDGCEVVLIDANHCPGAVQFLFKIPVGDGKLETYVHTGDFRYSDSMKLDPFLSEFVGADAIFLDTTYCNPKFVFPSQEESVDYIVGVIDRIGVENEGFVKNVLFLVATYVIGKEKILVEISRRCKRKIYVDGRKMAILNVLGLGEDGVFTEEESSSDVHVVGWNVLGETWPYFRPNFVKVNEIMNERGYSRVVGFVPTGWTYEVKRNKFAVRVKDASEIHLVPYSEHSNYDEIRDYVKFLKPKHVIPTVGMDVEKLDSKHAHAMQKHFAGLVNEMAIKQDFLMGFHRGAQEMVKNVEKSSKTLLNMVLDQEQKVTLPETDASNCMDQENAVNSFSQHQACSHDFSLLNGSGKEEIVQELRECLPTWVTKELLLDLLNSSGGNVVEAVSNFYECETEFYEQVIGCTSSACTLDTSLLNDSALPSKLPQVMTSPKCDNVGLNKSSNLSVVVHPIKNGISPGKRKKKLENKTGKKAKNDSNLELRASKQCTITRFFSKLSPVASQSAGNGRDDDENLFSDAVDLYKKEVDQFIQIIDGSESLRSLAHTILEEAKGDINLALDVYYSKSAGELSENKKSSVDCRELDEAQSSIQIYYPEKETLPEKTVNIPVMSLPAAWTENVSADLVSLPPEKYSPIEHACWSRGQPAPYIHLARTFDLVENEKGKIKATSMLCNMFRSLFVLSPEDVLPAVYLCTNKIAPDHENVELNIGGSIVVAALEEACGTNRSKIRELYNSLGDLGDVAQLCRQTQSLLAPPAPLTIRNVLSVLHKISSQTGSGSTVRKKGLIVNLMRSCREMEMKFLVRTLVRNLRIGAMMKTILPAVAQAVVMNSSLYEGTFENLKERIQHLSATVVEAYNVVPNLDILIPSLMQKGIRFCSTTLLMIPGIPLKPMLAKITNGIPQVLKLFQGKAFTCEFKYDGQRAQIHRLADGSLRVFSRNGDETTCRFPDLVNIVHECSPSAVTFVLDAEIVAVDRKNDCKLLSFQELSSRERGSRNSMITTETIKVDICIFVFDIMFANGEQLLSLPLRQRREYMKNLFGTQKLGYFEYARDLTVEAPDAYVTNEATLSNMNSFLDDAFRSSCEGIMVKSLDVEAGYAPSKRSDAWLKVKRDYVEGLNDSLDLVPIGAWYGNGRKAGWYSPFLMACYDPETEEFQSVCRVMSGFSDLFYTEMKEFFSGDKILAKKPPYYQTSEVPDLWFSPELVWEIRGADFTVSPVHHAAIGVVHPSRGISVRFPRFIRSVSDRKPEECSTATDLADMFNSQTRKMDVNVHH